MALKPNNFNDKNCETTSSSCVIWDGPKIDCIDLCPGDSVTTVVYELAKKLCEVMDQVNISNYDLKCFETNGCKPLDFKGFMNALITKVCAGGNNGQ